MKQITVDYIPRPKQVEFHKSSADECLFGGAKSPGKSCALTMECVAYAFEYPKSIPHIFRETYDDLDANIIQEFKKRVPAEAYQWNEQKHEAYLINGSTIKFRHVSNLNDAKKYQGRSIPWIGIDELTKHDEATVQELMSCNRSAEGFPVRFRATSNPGGKGHAWVKKRYITPTDYGKKGYVDPLTENNVQFIPATVYDGVLVESDPNYVKRLENLPESEKQAYLYGNWDIFEGQFFSGYFGVHNRCYPFTIPDQDDNGRIFGSLDHGIAHNTSFGLWWLSPDGKIYRIFTYSANGGTTRGHADAIVEAIESCRFTRYLFPCEVFYDYAMDTKHKLSEHIFRSDLDEYKDAFAQNPHGKFVNFIPANKRKVDGCHIMKGVFHEGNGEPIMQYFEGLNEPFADSVNEMLTDALNTEIYAKMDGDDETDEARYGIVGIVTKAKLMQQMKPKADKNKGEKIIGINDILKPKMMSLSECY